ncbi:MAG TPA: GGDEF domain-containing protein [Thermoanaerobaculaceae bacterium]|nr:GGDEF domain-containing protein [Thermoanaerobaculaceae bacterium]
MSPEFAILARWSLGVQTATVLLLAIFFAALSRLVRLREVRLWAYSWLSDALALAALVLTAAISPPGAIRRLDLALYVAGKTSYVYFLVRATAAHLRPGTAGPARPPLVALAIAAWAAAVGFLAPAQVHVRAAMDLIVGGTLVATGVWVLRHPRSPRSRWLAFGLLVEGGLFLHYLPLLVPALSGGRPVVGYLAYSSFFDAGAELLVALSILVVLEGSASEHLRHLNRELELSQDRLRQLVDHDPLTSLSNRRRLRVEFDRVRRLGATVIFLDVDNFKEINDRHGHIVGDACLLRLAAALGRTFRNDDALFRLGGDEFLVVAPGLDVEGAERRVGLLREALDGSGPDGPGFHLSVGIALLSPDGEPEAALREADDRMYLDKRRKKIASAERGSDVTRRSGAAQRAAG